MSVDARAVVEGIIQYARDGALEPMRELPPPAKATTKGKRTECEHVLLFGDMQAGLQTPTFNREIIKARVRRLADGVRGVLEGQRKDRPINTLHVGFLGDMVHGERIGRNVNWAELEDNVKSQCFDSAAPTCSYFLREMASVYNKVIVDAVPGNHGIINREHHYMSNWDIMTYEVAKAKLAEQSNVDFRVSDDFNAMFNVFDFPFFLFHGHQVVMRGIVPIYGIQRDIIKWNQSEGPFYAACCGHFHTSHYWENNGIKMFVNGTFLSDDRWTREYIKTTPSMSQWLLTVHPKRGIIDQSEISVLNGEMDRVE